MKGVFSMTLAEKLRYLEEQYPEAHQVVCSVVPNLVSHPDSPSEDDVDFYNYMIDEVLDEDDAEQLYHYTT